MRFGRGRGYDRSGGHLSAVRRGRSTRRPVLRELRRPCRRSAESPYRDPDRRRAEPCADCGNESYVDEYCTVCGHRRAEPDRDEADLGGIVLITDRGIEHAAQRGRRRGGILVGHAGHGPDAIAVAVCDGVSTSGDAQTAAVAASTAGVDAMLAALAASRRGTRGRTGGSGRCGEGRGGAAAADPATAPSCTYTAAIVVPTA